MSIFLTTCGIIQIKLNKKEIIGKVEEDERSIFDELLKFRAFKAD